MSFRVVQPWPLAGALHRSERVFLTLRRAFCMQYRCSGVYISLPPLHLQACTGSLNRRLFAFLVENCDRKPALYERLTMCEERMIFAENGGRRGIPQGSSSLAAPDRKMKKCVDCKNRRFPSIYMTTNAHPRNPSSTVSSQPY